MGAFLPVTQFQRYITRELKQPVEHGGQSGVNRWTHYCVSMRVYMQLYKWLYEHAYPYELYEKTDTCTIY